jgi:ABC-type uncharacterized transport system substrate-binding protein
VAGAAQANRAWHDASSGPARFHSDVGYRSVRCHPGLAPSLGVEVSPVNVRNAGEIERGVVALARSANGGLIVPATGWAFVHRDLIITLAARHKLPAVYFDRFLVAAGGLVAYGANEIDQYRRAAGYVDRILNGEKPADLPVQAPTTYELVLNPKTAKALGLDVPPTLLARRRDRIARCLVAVPKSAFGTKRTCQSCRSMSAFGGKADIQ